jgi:hypothetical protein
MRETPKHKANMVELVVQQPLFKKKLPLNQNQ